MDKRVLLLSFGLFAIFSLHTNGQVIEETTLHAKKPHANRHLLNEAENNMIYANEHITRDLQVGQVYFACATKDSMGVKNCLTYEYVSQEPIISFVVNRTVYEASRTDGYADLDMFTYETVAPNSECIGPQCTRRLDFGHDEEWCLVFVNAGVPSLNYFKMEEEPTVFSYKFNTCVSSTDMPKLALEGGTLVLALGLAAGLCAFWYACRPGHEEREEGYESLLQSPKFASKSKSPLSVVGSKVKSGTPTA